MTVSRRPPPIATAAGTLAQTSLLNALIYVRGERLTGTFDLHAPDGRSVRMLFARGRIAYIGTAPAVARFPDVAYELGLISTETLARVTMEAGLKQRPPAELLVEAGEITREQRDAAWSQQARRRVAFAFELPPETMYTFAEAAPAPVAVGLALDPLVPVWRAVGASPSAYTPHVQRRLGEEPLALTSSAGIDPGDFASDERALLSMLERPKTLEDLRAGSSLPPARAELFLYLLLLARCIEPVVRTNTLPAPAPSPKAAAPETPTLKVPKWRSFQLSLGEIQEALAAREASSPSPLAEYPKPKGPADLGAEGVRERAARIAFETPYAALGLPDGAPIEAARAAYVHASRMWHPHRLPPELEHVSAEAACVYMHILEAFGSLTDDRAGALEANA